MCLDPTASNAGHYLGFAALFKKWRLEEFEDCYRGDEANHLEEEYTQLIPVGCVDHVMSLGPRS